MPTTKKSDKAERNRTAEQLNIRDEIQRILDSIDVSTFVDLAIGSLDSSLEFVTEFLQAHVDGNGKLLINVGVKGNAKITLEALLRYIGRLRESDDIETRLRAEFRID